MQDRFTLLTRQNHQPSLPEQWITLLKGVALTDMPGMVVASCRLMFWFGVAEGRSWWWWTSTYSGGQRHSQSSTCLKYSSYPIDRLMWRSRADLNKEEGNCKNSLDGWNRFTLQQAGKMRPISTVRDTVDLKSVCMDNINSCFLATNEKKLV